MKQFIGTKVINATPMNRLEYNKFRGWELPKDENGEDEGYLVEYVGPGQKANTPQYKGYVSWSPRDVFEAAYHPAENMTFGEAIEALKQGKKVSREGWNGNRAPKVSPKPFLMPEGRFEVNGDYAFIKTNKGNVAIIDSDRVPNLNGVTLFSENNQGYLVHSFYSEGEQKNIALHRMLFDCPEGLFIDHINGDILDNRSENIRFVTSAQNNQNRGRSSGNYKGVSFDKSRSKWIASIQIEGATKHLGRYLDEVEAAHAYDSAALKYFGEYARLNFPDEVKSHKMWLVYMPPFVVEEPNERTRAHGITEAFSCGGYIVMWTAQGIWQPGWLASQADMLADDWMVV